MDLALGLKKMGLLTLGGSFFKKITTFFLILYIMNFIRAHAMLNLFLANVRRKFAEVDTQNDW